MSSERLQACFQALRSTGELVLTSAFATSARRGPAALRLGRRGG